MLLSAGVRYRSRSFRNCAASAAARLLLSGNGDSGIVGGQQQPPTTSSSGRVVSARRSLQRPTLGPPEGIRAFASHAGRDAGGRNKNSGSDSKNAGHEKKKKRSGLQPVKASSGRIAYTARGGGGGKSSVKLCSGCGVQVASGGGRSETEAFVTGQDAIENMSKNKAKKLKYADALDLNRGGSGFLCQRCQYLQSGDLWNAYDALHDVSPKVFRDQLQHIVTRRRFGMALMVVDATDAEHSVVKNLRRCIGKTSVWIVLNKIDLMPRMNQNDVKTFSRRIQQASGLLVSQIFPVSAKDETGIFQLAKSLLGELQGRDVFVLGAANVGKSTLVKKLSGTIATALLSKSRNRMAHKRREAVTDHLKITGSNLPGTTLQALRIPCFMRDGHALWDTPGIINPRALQYSIFPSHLMEPLTRPEPLAMITRSDDGKNLILRPEMSLLVEATWMHEGRSDEPPCVLARIDVIRCVRNIAFQAYLHPSLRVRVVPTSEAPDHATIPKSHAALIGSRMSSTTKSNAKTATRNDNNEHSIPLKPFVAENERGEITARDKDLNPKSGFYNIDIVFPSLGWIAISTTVTASSPFTIVPHCVDGSVFSKRRSVYPWSLPEYLQDDANHVWHDHGDEPLSSEDQMNQLRNAAKNGRHQKERHGDDLDEWDGEDGVGHGWDDDSEYY